ncbi:MAG: ribonuclease HI family protein [Nitrospira sp.]|nr:ribonuclease HI family protein [bacterium]MBL7049294.1 ribonuclease HI family protein [Nitrospira sp.]
MPLDNLNGHTQQSLFSGQSIKTVSAVMFSDGACSGNPGPSGVGAVIRINQKDADMLGVNSECTISEYIGSATNNIAEYTAVVRGLEKALDLGVTDISVSADSELLVRQVNGIYKVKNQKLLPLYKKVMDLLNRFQKYKVSHVRREFNSEADALAREAVELSRS